MHVLVLHNAVPDGAPPDVADVLSQVEAVSLALQKLGHEVSQAPATLDLGALRGLLDHRVDAVFNLVEDLGGTGRLSPLVPALVVGLGLPCTGAGSVELALADDKLRAKRAMLQAQIPTPSFRTPDSVWHPQRPSGRIVMKARFEHASLGLEVDSVIEPSDDAELSAALDALEKRIGSEAFAEKYVHGREFNVALVPAAGRLTPLSPAEILFQDIGNGEPHIVGYRAKWEEDSVEYAGTPRRNRFPPSDEPLLRRLKQLALKACRAVGVVSYCRVDFRVDERGQPFVLEVNANPCLSPDAGFAAALENARLPFDSAIAEILAAARRRAEERTLGLSVPADWNYAAAEERFGQPATAPTPAALPAAHTALPLRTVPRQQDVDAVTSLVRSTGYFTPEEVTIAAELVQERLTRGQASGYNFVFLDEGADLVGYACWGATPGTDLSFDLYWIAVDSRRQGEGLGRRLCAAVEAEVALVSGGDARIYAETSGTARYISTRKFYERCGYHLAAKLEDFYRQGDDKVIYIKVVS